MRVTNNTGDKRVFSLKVDGEEAYRIPINSNTTWIVEGRQAEPGDCRRQAAWCNRAGSSRRWHYETGSMVDFNTGPR